MVRGIASDPGNAKETEMKKMTKKSGGLVVGLAVAVGLMATPLQAQQGFGVRGQRAGPNMGRSLEVALDQQEQLGLTEDQVAQLQGLKAVIDEDVAVLGEEMRGLRESIRAGDVERDEGVRQMEALRGELITASAPLRGRVQEILTVEQHNILRPMAAQARPGGGRGGAFQGRGVSSLRGRGMGRGRGGRPGMGMPGQVRGSWGGGWLRLGVRGQGGGPMGGLPAAAGEGVNLF